MGTKILLELLMLSGIFFQGSASLSEINIDASSDRHFRQKRVIDICHNRDERVLRQEVPYVVRLLNRRKGIECTGIILRPRIILTAAHCVYNLNVYIATGARATSPLKIYKVVRVKIHDGFEELARKNDIALVMINKPIDLEHSYHKPIPLYEGRLPANSHGLFSGWGWTQKATPDFPSQALSILLPIISLQQCQNIYRNQAVITSHEICTYYTNRTKTCWFGDSGGPLVVNGHLVGLLSWFRSTDETGYPDVFMNLMDSGYKMWIEAWINNF